MNLKRKLEIASDAIKSVSGHRDEDAAILLGALDKIADQVAAEKAALVAALDAEKAAALG
jgi:hypothetical protein